MIAMATRLVNTVVNRLNVPSDGDIIVPVGTVAVLGTTDTPVDDADDVGIEAWEIDLLLREAAALVPSIEDHRPLRAWAGIRPLYRRPDVATRETRQLPRGHALIDHGAAGGPQGLVTILGGKLTTYRRMAEDTVDLVSKQLGSSTRCRTKETVLSPPPRRFHLLPGRLEDIGASGVVCECELVSTADIRRALEASGSAELDDLRRDLRLGMGPCQAAFCAFRSAGILQSRDSRFNARAAVELFLEERWRGLRPLTWGAGLRQLEFNRRVYMDLLGVDRS
jgi:glycerol-3-phosphate dehydrogenase